MKRGEKRFMGFQTIVDVVNIYSGLVWKAVEGVRDQGDAISKVKKGGHPAFFVKNWDAYNKAVDFEWELKKLCERFEPTPDPRETPD